MPRTKFDLQWIVEKRMDKVLYLVNREYDIPTKNKKIGNAWNNETTTISVENFSCKNMQSRLSGTLKAEPMGSQESGHVSNLKANEMVQFPNG